MTMMILLIELTPSDQDEKPEFLDPGRASEGPYDDQIQVKTFHEHPAKVGRSYVIVQRQNDAGRWRKMPEYIIS